MNNVMPLVKLANRRALTQSLRGIAAVTQAHTFPGERSPLGKYGGRHMITVLPGDGIGPEMVAHLQRVFRFANVPVDFEEVPLSSDVGEDAFENAIISVQRNGIAIKGNIESRFNDPAFKSRNVELRRRLDLYANVLHCASIPTVRCRHKDIDIVLIRENTEGEYSGLEHEAIKGVVESIKIVTRHNIERIARFAFQYALLNNRKRVTCVHKANIQKLGDGLFLKVCREMAARDYPSLQLDSMIVDNASMQLVSNPQQFDVMLMPNLYGNIISNIACGLVGGAGLVSGINIGSDYAVFETGTRNTATMLAGKDLANPTAFLCAGIDMLHYLHLHEHAMRISNALYKSLTKQDMHTKDIGGEKRSSEVIDSVINNLRDSIEHFG
uniref:Isocitrate dehydrogenase [NAD] subunit, mitochondrial n=2 Tax=Ascaris TaxID=6251 RepID=F1L8D9_ASCSU